MDEQHREDEIEIDLWEIFHLLWRKAWLIILCLVIGVVIAGAATKLLIVPQYTSSSMIYILTKTTSVTSLADIQMGTQLTVDFEKLATSRPVVEEVIEKLGLNSTYNEVVAQVKISNPADTRILQIDVEDPNPELAQKIANQMADATANRVADVMDTEKPNVVEEAVIAESPSSPNLMKNMLIGGVLFAFLMIGFLIVRMLMDDTIKSEEDVLKYLELNTLAVIPLEAGEVAEMKRKSNKTGSKKKKSRSKRNPAYTRK